MLLRSDTSIPSMDKLSSSFLTWDWWKRFVETSLVWVSLWEDWDWKQEFKAELNPDGTYWELTYDCRPFDPLWYSQPRELLNMWPHPWVVTPWEVFLSILLGCWPIVKVPLRMPLLIWSFSRMWRLNWFCMELVIDVFCWEACLLYRFFLLLDKLFFPAFYLVIELDLAWSCDAFGMTTEYSTI